MESDFRFFGQPVFSSVFPGEMSFLAYYVVKKFPVRSVSLFLFALRFLRFYAAALVGSGAEMGLWESRFFSSPHVPDGRLAPAVQNSLQCFACLWYRCTAVLPFCFSYFSR